MVGSLSARKIAQQQATQQLGIDIECLKSYELECQKGSMSTETFSRIMNKASAEAQAYSVNIKNGTGSAQIYAQNQKVLQSSMAQTSIVSKVASVGLNLFKTALNSIIFFGVIEGISLLVKGIDHLILTADEAEEAANNLRSSIQTFFDDVNAGNKTISSISDRFNELSKHVTKTGENVDLTEEEYSEFLDICNQVKGIMPELVTGYTAEGDAIITLKDNVDSLSESYKQAIRLKAAMFISNGDEDGNTIESFFDDYRIFTNGEGGLFAPSAGGAWNNKTTDYEDYYGYDEIHKWLSDVTGLGLEDLQTKIKDIVSSTQATYLYALLKENDLVFSEITSENFNQVHDILNNRLTSLEQQMLTRVNNIQMSLRQMLYADKDYWDIDNKEALSAIDSLFTSVDDEFIKQNELFSQSALQAFESNVIKLFQNKSTQQSMVDLYVTPTDDESVSDYVARIKTAIEAIQTYCKENGINIPISLENISSETEILQQQYKNAIQSAKDKFNGEDLTPFFEENSINTQEEIDKWIECANSCDTATEAKKRYLETDVGDETPVLSFTEDQVKAIDDYKSDLKTLQTALEDLDNTDVTDLITKFNDYDWSAYQSGAKTLEDVINELAARALNNLSSSLGNTADMFKYLYDEIFDAEAKLSSLEAELTKNTDEFNSLQEAINKVRAGQSFSADEISSLINTYSELADKIIITADGYSIEESALSSLADSNKAANNKIIAAEIKSTETVIEQTKAKINALKITLDAYNQVANAWNGGYGDNESAEGNKQLLEAENKLSELLERLNNLQGRFLESEISSSSGPAKAASEFAESVDWLSQSIEALEANVDGLNDTFDNAKGYDEQIKSIDNLIAGQKELQSAYDTTSKTYDSLYKDKLDKLKALGLSDKEVQQVHNRINGLSADKLRELYDSGNISSLFEDFKGKGDNSTAEKLYNEIQDAINIAQQKLDNQQNFLKIGVELDKNALQKLELSRDNNQAKADVINARLDDDELTDRLKLKLLGQLQEQIEALYNDEIAIAKANKDTNEQKKLEIERAKELRDIESQRNEILNGSVDAMIARHERKIRDIQNVIDETGRATFEQYQAMIAEGDAQTRLYEQKVAQAQSEIQLLESRGINSGEAYNDAVENLGKCKDELSECIQKTKDWHTAILNLNIENINKVLDSFGDKLDIINKDLNDVNKSMSDYEDYISAAQYVVQQQIDAQNELKESLQNQLDTLQDSNEARQQALNLQKALWELEKAKNQKTVKVYREGQGYIYEADQNAVRTAQENYDNALYNNKVYQIQTQIDGIDDYISSLSKIQDKWGNITKEIENASNLAKTMAKYGNDFVVKVISGDASFMQGIVDIVTSLNRQKDSLEQSQERIESLKSTFNDMKDDMEDWVKSYEESGISFEETVQKMKGVVEDVYPSISQAIKQEGINITRYIQEILNSFGDDVSEGIKLGVDTAMSGAVTGALIGSGIYDNLQDVKNNVKESGTVIGDNLNKIVKDTSKSYDKITNIIKDELNEQESIISDSTDAVSDYFTSMANQTTEALDGLVSEMQRVAKVTSDLATQIRNSTSVSSVGEISSPVIGGMLGAGIGTNLIKPPIYHNGIEKGFIGGEKFNSKKKELFKLLGIKELKPNEELAILQKGEAVFNEKQQAMVLRNFQSVLERSIIPPEIPNYDFTKEQQLPSVNVEFGANSIVLNEVNSGEELIKEMTSRIKPIFMQTFSSINRY